MSKSMNCISGGGMNMVNMQMELLYFINNGLQNLFLDMVVPVIYSITDVRVIFTLIILVLIGSLILKKNRITKIALYCLAAYCLSIVLIMISKTFYPSPRPFIAYESIRLAVHDNGFYSFPSGHFGHFNYNPFSHHIDCR